MPNYIPSQIHSKGYEQSYPADINQIITEAKMLPPHKYNEAVIPYSKTVKILWDTGASKSCIRTDLAEKYKFPIISSITVMGAGGPFLTNSYLMGLLLPNNIIISEIEVMGLHNAQEIDMLIGMDIIKLGDFLVSTHNEQMYFSFQMPSMGGITLFGIKKIICTNGRIAIHK
jgi:hypothetical protein